MPKSSRPPPRTTRRPPPASIPIAVDEAPTTRRSPLAGALAEVARLQAHVGRLEEQRAEDASLAGAMMARIAEVEAHRADLETEVASLQTRFADAVQRAMEAQARADTLAAEVELLKARWAAESRSGTRPAMSQPPTAAKEEDADDVDAGWDIGGA